MSPVDGAGGWGAQAFKAEGTARSEALRQDCTWPIPGRASERAAASKSEVARMEQERKRSSLATERTE